MYRYLYVLLIILFSTPLSYAKLSLGGALENRSTMMAGNSPFEFQNFSRLKIDLNYKEKNWRIYSDIRLGLMYGENDFGGGVNDPTANIPIAKNTDVILDIPRLYMKIKSNVGTFTIGKTYLTFGQPELFNVLEWYKNFSLLDPTETKPGVNLISWDLGIGSYGKIGMFLGGDDEWEDVLGGVEFIFGRDSFEAGLVYQYKGDNQNVVGGFFKADVVVALLGSYAYHANDILTESGSRGYNDYHEATVGVDYSFLIGSRTLVVKQTFYFNSIGARDKKELLTTTLGDYYFRGGGYSYTSFMFTIDQFIQVGLDVIVNVFDGSGSVLPRGIFQVANNLMLDISMGSYFGSKGSEFAPSNKGGYNFSLFVKLEASF